MSLICSRAFLAGVRAFGPGDVVEGLTPDQEAHALKAGVVYDNQTKVEAAALQPEPEKAVLPRRPQERRPKA